MKIPFELTIGLTYTRAGRRGRRKDRFLSFISGMSVASIALGVAALIIVLSVMTGFQQEVRDRMLGVIPHIEITNGMGPMTDWRSVAADVMKNPEVVAAAPYVQGQGLLNSGSVVRGAMVKGIDPETEPGVSDISQHLERVESRRPQARQLRHPARTRPRPCAARASRRPRLDDGAAGQRHARGPRAPHEAVHGARLPVFWPL